MQERGKRKSAARLRREVELPVSLPTVLKILREEGLYKGTRKGVEKKRDLREVKKRLKAFEKLQIDMKYLDDIPELYAKYVYGPLQCVRGEYGISLSGSGNQTENGTEFTAPWNSRKVTAFTGVVENCLGATHHLIPPGAKTYQSDVESFHRWVEEELYAAESFGSGVSGKSGVLPGSVQLQEAQ